MHVGTTKQVIPPSYSLGYTVSMQTDHNLRVKLFTAIRSKDLTAVNEAIAQGADLQRANHSGGRTPLEEAVFVSTPEIVNTFIAAGRSFRSADISLHDAVENGSIDVLRQVLNTIPPNSCSGIPGEYSPLMRAAKTARLDMCRLLLERGADIKNCNSQGISALHYALFRARPAIPSQPIIDLVEFLLENGVPVRSSVESPQHIINAKDFIVENYPPLNSAILLALENQHFVDERLGVRLCEMLISRGADVNAANETGGTPLHQIGRPMRSLDGFPVFDSELIPILVKSGADINARAFNGATPLHCAAGCKNIKALRQLLAHGADPRLKDSSGQTAEEFALSEGCPEAHSFLRQHRELKVLDKDVSGAGHAPRSRI
jgi:ankyrin repeat protein